MAVQLRAADTRIVLHALQSYRTSLLEVQVRLAARDVDISDLIEDVARLEKSYDKSFKALCRWGKW
jgi:hypothetical protein